MADNTGMLFRVVLLASASWCAAAFAQGGAVNLVPATPGTAPSYWCTWGAQNFAIDKHAIESAMSHSTMAANLTEARVFGPHAWATAFPKVHKDLFLLFDLGWDVPANVEFDSARWKLGSMEVASDKFPSCTGSPVERLRRLDELVKGAGWHGAALWVPAHAYLDGKDGKPFTQAELDKFYRERLAWSRAAGIRYWKVDYGSRNNAEFRAWLTKLAAEVSPGLQIEHSRGSCPLNDTACLWEKDLAVGDKGDFAAWGNGSVLAASAAIARLSQSFRTYDVTAPLSVPTTIDRAAQILRAVSGNASARGFVNCEDEPYIAAALGLVTGIMRHPQWIDPKEVGVNYDPHDLRKRIDEVTRAVRWHRLAPPFAMNAPISLDARRLDDTFLFHAGETWADWVIGKEVIQGAPARVARGLALPEVKGGELPFVLASRNPNGAIAVATLPRVATARGFYFPLADVTIAVPDAKAPIGIFGRYRSLTLELPASPGAVRVLAQDLAGDQGEDITDQVRMKGGTIVIPGSVIDRTGLRAASARDVSDPGLVVVLGTRR